MAEPTVRPCWLDPGDPERGQWVDLSTLLYQLERLGYECTMAVPLEIEDAWHLSHWESETESSPGCPMPHQWLVLKEHCPPIEANAYDPHAHFSWRDGYWLLTQPIGWVLPDPDRVDQQLISRGYADV